MSLANEVDARSANALFRARYSALIARAGQNANAVVRKIAIDMTTRMVMRSPVDTGRFRGNWNCGIGGLDRTIDSPNDTSGSGSIQRAIQVIQTTWQPGQTIYITNSLPYARRIEYGWSKQAPQGVVRLTLVEFKNLVDSAVQDVKG